MKVLIARKGGMTQYFDENANAFAVTILSNAEMTVIGTKTESKDGYNAIVVGYGSQKAKRLSKAQLGMLKGMGPFQKVKEFRINELENFETGKVLDAGEFASGDIVTVSGISKGKGFQGVVKRHGFKGKGSIHNAHHALREPGSIGGGGRAGGRVVRGHKMAGRMGSDRVTVRNLKVVAVDPTTKTILVKGAVPGNTGGIVEISKA